MSPKGNSAKNVMEYIYQLEGKVRVYKYENRVRPFVYGLLIGLGAGSVLGMVAVIIKMRG